ncbi:hypothetical protein T484DRAFT_1921493, partial [Baffinella frigidus]
MMWARAGLRAAHLGRAHSAAAVAAGAARGLAHKRFGEAQGKKLPPQEEEGVLGLSLRYGAGGEVLVAGLVQGGAASRAGGIHLHDEIVRVGAKEVRGHPPVNVVDMMCGPVGGFVTLAVRRSRPVPTSAPAAEGSAADAGEEEEVWEVELSRASAPAVPLLEDGVSALGGIAESVAETALSRPYKVAASDVRLLQEAAEAREQEVAESAAGNMRGAESAAESLPKKDIAVVGGYACASCDATFLQWRNCMKHMRWEHHVRHDLLPHVRDKKTKMMWIDKTMDKNLRLLLRIYPASSSSSSASSASSLPEGAISPSSSSSSSLSGGV